MIHKVEVEVEVNVSRERDDLKSRTGRSCDKMIVETFCWAMDTYSLRRKERLSCPDNNAGT